MLFSNGRLIQEIKNVIFFIIFPFITSIKHYLKRKLEEKTILAKEEVLSTAVETSQQKSSNLCSF